jgi:exopolyphosphatase / guanosine-5'-triphosphate,3'-diphosphate pyrophosphatase
VIGNIARYHRRGLPTKAHLPYVSRSREERVRINKLASMLRVANALDAEHAQKVQDVQVREEDGGWVLELTGTGDLTMERLAASSRADLLTEVFGKHVTVRGAGAGS